MKKTSSTLVFFGSGPLAAGSLANLIANFKLSCVVTKKRPAHHKDPAPVEELARTNELIVQFANTAAELEAVVESLGPNIYGLVVDFGIIFNQKSLQALDGRLINSHFSRLPEWRGADPITYSLLSGQKQTAVSLIRVAPELDSGEILAQSAVTIEAADNSHSLSRKLLKTSNDLINRTLDGWMAGQTTLRKQPPGPITYSRQINKSDGQLDFQKPAAVLERQIRAFSDWPGSHCTIGQLEVLVTKAEAVQETLAVRQIVIEQKNLLIGCRVGSLKILQLKPVNRQNMTVAGFLNGYQAKLKDNLIAG